jgi:endonuclease-3
VQSIGLFRNKAKNVVALSEILLREHGGKVPANREALEELPGVGRKTANVVSERRVRATHDRGRHAHLSRRQSHGNRTGQDPEEVERKLEKFVPDEFKLHAHHWLILHGRYVCVARGPHCAECAIRDLCEFRQKTG